MSDEGVDGVEKYGLAPGMLPEIVFSLRSCRMSMHRSHVVTLNLMAFLLVPAITQGQTAPTTVEPNKAVTFEVSGGYQVLHVPDQTFPFGLNVDGAWNPNPSLGLVGEVGWAFDTEDEGGADVNFHAWNIGVGPRWNYREPRSVWPFAQVLVGAFHGRVSGDINGVDISDSATKFMVQPGAGVYADVGDGWGIVGSVDYRRVFLDEDEDGDSGENEVRAFVGVRLLLD